MVSVEEQMRGWLAKIHGAKAIVDQLPYYDRLARLVEFYVGRPILRIDQSGATFFQEL